jgi:FAD/FMN-containing dehydrogenase
MSWRHEALPADRFPGLTLLPFGNGRSYGDVCLNDGGALIDVRPLNRLVAFDAVGGRITCEAGVLLSEILEIAVPRGWFLTVTPGTQFVTVGGAIANDVHGKNHHRAGSFGCHVYRFELLRSDGSRLICSATENQDWFRATVGGLGLTGLITWAEIQLKPIVTPFMEQEVIKFAGLDEFYTLSDESDGGFEYTVAWVDCLATGRHLGRGHFIRGNHSKVKPSRPGNDPKARLGIPVDIPFSVVNRLSLKLFNWIYFHRQMRRTRASTVHYAPFFYPLDSIPGWNRMYGPRGFVQYQCVIPHENGRAAIQEILTRISRAKMGSFLAVLKVFGDTPSPGLLSFSSPGVTLALDFPVATAGTLGLLNELDDITCSAGGKVYPAKDARMSAGHFERYFPNWRQLVAYMDPRFSSGFWRRVRPDSL